MPGWFRYFSMLLVASWAGVIFFLSSQPGIDIPPPFPHMDKVLHAIAFGVLGFLLLGAFRPGVRGYSRKQLVIAITIAGTYGILDEIHQRYVPGRMPDALDVMADLVGAALGVWLMHVIVRRRQQPT
jgi:VanZ family protein